LVQKKKHTLDGTHELPFVLIAISCSESLHKTAWSINKMLNINLKETDTLIQAKDNPSFTFPVFSDSETSEIHCYSLISNKSSGVQLVKELPKVDFILEILGVMKRIDLADLIKALKQIPGIHAALEVNAEKIKRKSAYCPF